MDKPELRARMRGHAFVDPDEADRIVTAVRAWLSARLPGTVAAFLAMPSEVDLSPLFDALPGWRWVLPRVESGTGSGARVTFRDRDVPREMHAFGMRQPTDSGEIIPIPEIDLFLVPGVAFDRKGGRLGNGGGYYDRILSSKRNDALAVGVAPAIRVVESVPREDHDVEMDMLATASGVIECSPSR